MGVVSRRAVLSVGGAAGAAGALGFGAGSAGAAPSPRTSLTLHGSALRVVGPRRRREAGDQVTVHGSVHRAVDGPVVGTVIKTGTVLSPSGSSEPLASVEHHLFQLDDGTLTGTGTVTHDGIGEFTVTGGSGRYAGARGTYRSRQHADHSGGGSAHYAFSLL